MRNILIRLRVSRLLLLLFLVSLLFVKCHRAKSQPSVGLSRSLLPDETSRSLSLRFLQLSMEAPPGAVAPPQEQQQQQPAAGKTERLNPAVQQQLNLESVKTRALSLYKAISRILEEFDAYARTNTTPKWSLPRSLFSSPPLALVLTGPLIYGSNCWILSLSVVGICGGFFHYRFLLLFVVQNLSFLFFVRIVSLGTENCSAVSIL